MLSVTQLIHAAALLEDINLLPTIFQSRISVVLPNASATGAAWEPLVSQDESAPNPQFYVGSAGTGAPVHFHTDGKRCQPLSLHVFIITGYVTAWNAIAYGQKRWYLISPANALYSREVQKCYGNCSPLPVSTLQFPCSRSELGYHSTSSWQMPSTESGQGCRKQSVK
jgi:hypothetical protein